MEAEKDKADSKSRAVLWLKQWTEEGKIQALLPAMPLTPGMTSAQSLGVCFPFQLETLVPARGDTLMELAR